ncbi:MAG: hypothetical protein C0503_00785 [Gemmatimonas sp.]|nr:hypothetical protein [Gemmatimonas sp.]
MARIRTIKPEFADDEKLAKVSRDARLTFVLLITQADDYGLIPGSPRQLLGSLFPLDESVSTDMLRAWISELVSIGAVRWRSTVDGAPVVELTQWANHQKVDHPAKPVLRDKLAPAEAAASVQSREDVPRDSRDPRPPTLDQRPTTEDHRPAAAAHARVEIARTANDAIDAAFGTTNKRRSLLPGTAAAVLEVLEQDAVPLDFALQAIRDAVPALKEPPRSLAYFAPIVRERWEQRQVAPSPAGRRTGRPAPRSAVTRQERNLAAVRDWLEEGEPSGV